VVLFVSYSGALGGAERLLVEIAPTLDAPSVIACPPGELADAVRERGVTVIELRPRSLRLRGSRGSRLGALGALAGHRAELRRLVRDVQPELVVAWGMRTAIATLLGPRLGRPVAFHHNDLLPGPIVAWAVRAAAARAERSIAVSYAVAADLDPGRRLGSRLHVIHPGVDAERFFADRAPVDPPEVLVLGTLAGWKRPDLALTAAALARRTCPELRLRLVGAPLDRDGERLQQVLAERAERLGFVELVGPAADPAEDLARATCLLHCAEREPFGRVVAEALAAGRPVVAPAAGGPAEIVDGTCGLLYRPGSARGAADALSELLGDRERARRLGTAGRDRVRRRFSLADTRARYAAALRPLLPPRAAVSDGDADGRPGLALVTVTHNSAEELRALIASLHRHLHGARLIVVDCDSRDDTVAVAEASPAVEVIALGENIGFGRAINRGLDEVTEPVAAIVNPDVELIDGSLAVLAREAQRADRLLAPLVLSGDGRRQDTVHPLPASAPDLVRALIPPAALPGRLSVALAPWRSREPRRVGWAVACALVARTATLRRLGPFDERIFLYGEDLDLGLRAAASGIETWFWPSARVLHHRAHASTRAFGGEPFELLARGRHEVVARRMGAGRGRLDDAAQTVTFASRAALKRALGRDAVRERRQLAALARVARGQP
jgi:glycosyltransferase involved in cell wall biosynthesis/GT2 family glycosyltransferase